MSSKTTNDIPKSRTHLFASNAMIIQNIIDSIRQNLWFSCLLACITLFLSCTGGKAPHKASVTQQETDSLAELMYQYYDEADFANVVKLGKDVLQRYEALGDSTSMSDIIGTMCIAYLRVGNIEEGLRMSQRAIEIDSILGEPELLSSDYNTIAGLYLSEDKAQEAEPFILKAIDYEMKTPGQPHLSNRCGIAAEIYCKMHQPEKARTFALKGLQIAEEHGDSAQMGTRLSQLGDTYMALGEMELAEETFLRCSRILEATRSAVSLAIVYRQLGNIYEDRHDIPQAITYYERSADLARQMQYTMLLCQCTQAIGELSAGDHPDRSVQMLMESRALADTLHSQKVEEMMAEFATKFDLKEKQLTIEQQAAELKIHRIITTTAVSFAIVSVIIIVIIIIAIRLRRKGEALEIRLSEKVVQEALHQEPALNQSDREFLAHLAEYVEQHLGQSNLSSTTIASDFCLSPRQFSRRVKTLTGVDTTHYIRASRIASARQLLTETELSIQEIYLRCGFESANYFSRIFRSDVGLSPTEYRQKNTQTT